LNSQL